MNLSHEFDVSTDIDTAWLLFTDPVRVASCMPGARLDSIADDGELQGRVKVKLGAIVTEFRGKARYTEQAADRHELLLVADGAETRGASSASAEIRVRLNATTESSTHAVVDISMTTVGRIAQFGRSVLQDVSVRLLSQFLSCVEGQLHAAKQQVASADTRASSTSPAPASSPAPGDNSRSSAVGPGFATQDRTVETNDDVIDLFGIAGPALIRRGSPVVVGAFVGFLIGICVSGHRRARR